MSWFSSCRCSHCVICFLDVHMLQSTSKICLGQTATKSVFFYFLFGFPYQCKKKSIAMRWMSRNICAVFSIYVSSYSQFAHILLVSLSLYVRAVHCISRNWREKKPNASMGMEGKAARIIDSHRICISEERVYEYELIILTQIMFTSQMQ